MAELERALAGLASCSSGSAGASAAAGMVLFKLFVVFREAQRVFVLKDATSRYSEWPYLQVSAARAHVSAVCVLAGQQQQQQHQHGGCAALWCHRVHLSCMQADLLELVTPGVPASAKLELHRRMLRTYGLLQP